MTTNTGSLSRVTIVAPQSRVDLSVPSDVPFSEMLPTMLRQLGSNTPDEGVTRGGWVLTRLSGDHLDIGKSAIQLAVRDGEVLYLTNAQTATPEMVFDDVIEAVATNTNAQGSRWNHQNTRTFCLTLTAVVLSLGVPVTLLSGPPHLAPSITAFGIAAALIGLAAVMSRIYDEPRAAMVFSIPALGYAAVAGLGILSTNPAADLWHPSHVLLAACSLLIFGVLGLVAVPRSAPVLLALLIASGALALGSGLSMIFSMSAVSGAAIIIPLALMFMPSLPMQALRLAKMPIPTLPTTVEEMKRDEQHVDGNRVLATAERANTFLSALLAAMAAICGIAGVVVALGGGVPGIVLCGVLSLVLFLRVRPVLGRGPRIPVLAAGTVGLCTVAIAGFLAGGQVTRLLLVLGGLLVVVAIVTTYGLVVTGRQTSPVWGRLLDIIEVILIVAVMPLAAWAANIFSWLLAWAG